MVRNILKRLRAQNEKVKMIITWVGALLITFIILSIWYFFTIIMTPDTPSEQSSPTTDNNHPTLQTIKTMIRDIMQSITNTKQETDRIESGFYQSIMPVEPLENNLEIE